METTENTEVQKTSKTHYETLDEKITKMKVTFDNATLPQIFAVMVTVGYTAEKIADMKAKLNQLVQLNVKQNNENAEQSAAQIRFNKKRAEINGLFNTHRGLLRILFKGNDLARKQLQFDLENPTAYGSWNQLVARFYSQLLAPDLLTKAATIGITEEIVAAQTQALIDLDGIKDIIIHESGEAIGATRVRDEAFDELYPLYSDYVKYAKLLLPDKELLKMIGITVK